MNTDLISIEKIRELIHSGEISDPLIFLESVMNGQDPRCLSEIYILVCEINDLTGGQVSGTDWADICDLVYKKYKYQSVSLSESTSAAKTLSEYLYAKRKHVDINGADDKGKNSSPPLTEEEIKLFKEKFNEFC